MHRGLAAVAMFVLLGCAGNTQSNTSSTASPGGDLPEARETVRTTAVVESKSGPSHVLGTHVLGTDAVEIASVCSDRRPVVPAQVGSVNTIVVPVNTQDFDGAVDVIPAAACPGDRVSFVVSIVNVSQEASVFSAGRGLIFYSGGMANWSVGSLKDLEVIVQPGERLDQTVAGTIPPVAPGRYRTGPEGAGFAGEITVLDPTAS